MADKVMCDRCGDSGRLTIGRVPCVCPACAGTGEQKAEVTGVGEKIYREAINKCYEKCKNELIEKYNMDEPLCHICDVGCRPDKEYIISEITALQSAHDKALAEYKKHGKCSGDWGKLTDDEQWLKFIAKCEEVEEMEKELAEYKRKVETAEDKLKRIENLLCTTESADKVVKCISQTIKGGE